MYFFFFNATPTPEIYPLSLHDALPIFRRGAGSIFGPGGMSSGVRTLKTLEAMPDKPTRSEEHTSELQSRFDLVCRLLLEKKKTHLPLPFARQGPNFSLSHSHPNRAGID